jgi:hypothetical protein
MEFMLGLHIVWLVGLFLAIPFVSAGVLHWVTQHSPLAPALKAYSGVVGPFFVSVGLLFGLFATFLAVDVWERVSVSNRSLELEVGALQTIKQLSQAIGEVGKAVDAAVEDYAIVTLNEEWKNDRNPRSAAADDALGRLAGAIIDPKIAEAAGSAAQAALLTCFHELREARATRIHIASTHSDPYKWATVILLGILTQVALVFCHIGDRKAQFVALLLFSTGFAITLIALGVHERPLADPELVRLEHMHSIAE